MCIRDRPSLEAHGQDGNVVLLAKTLGGLRDLSRGEQDQAGEPLETVELAARVASFRDAVGEQNKMLSASQPAMVELIFLITPPIVGW